MAKLIALSLPLALAGTAGRVAPVHGTPCTKFCFDDPSSLDCATCCRSVPHETSWNCLTSKDFDPAADSAPACDGDWDPSYWDVNSLANFDHACSQCSPEYKASVYSAPGCADGSKVQDYAEPTYDLCRNHVESSPSIDIHITVPYNNPCYLTYGCNDGGANVTVPLGTCINTTFGSFKYFESPMCAPINCDGQFIITSPCPSCGNGTLTKTYAHFIEAEFGGTSCEFEDGYEETEDCPVSDPCPVNCTGSFGAYSACTVTEVNENCGVGTQTRMYTINTAAANNGAACPYTDGYNETTACNVSCDVSGAVQHFAATFGFLLTVLVVSL